MENATQVLLLYFIMPLWFVAGLADFLCHRATDIEHTGGPRESLFHLLMLFEISVPLLMCLFLEINAFVFAVMIVAFIAHQATALWDVSYAIKRRYISPIEQHVHSFLELIPLMAGTLIAISHWPQFLALFGLGTEAPRFGIELKKDALPVSYIIGVLGASLFMELLPYLDELRRGAWASRGRKLRH